MYGVSIVGKSRIPQLDVVLLLVGDRTRKVSLPWFRVKWTWWILELLFIVLSTQSIVILINLIRRWGIGVNLKSRGPKQISLGSTPTLQNRTLESSCPVRNTVMPLLLN